MRDRTPWVLVSDPGPALWLRGPSSTRGRGSLMECSLPPIPIPIRTPNTHNQLPERQPEEKNVFFLSRGLVRLTQSQVGRRKYVKGRMCLRSRQKALFPTMPSASGGKGLRHIPLSYLPSSSTSWEASEIDSQDYLMECNEGHRCRWGLWKESHGPRQITHSPPDRI